MAHSPLNKSWNPQKTPPTSAGGVELSVTSPAAPLIAANDEVVKAPSPATLPAVEIVNTAPVHVFLATFAIRDKNTGKIRSEVVEVPHTQQPKIDQLAAWTAIRKQNPGRAQDDIRRTAGRIISRPGGRLPAIPVRDGETIKQLFPDKSEHEAARTVGTVIFEGALCDVILRHIRAKSAFAVTLRQPGGVVINFSEQITTTRLVDELPKLIADIIGEFGSTLKLYFQKT